MEIEGDSERDFSESDLSDEEIEVNAYGSPIRTVNRAHSRETTVTGAVAAPSTSDAVLFCSYCSDFARNSLFLR